MAKCDLDPLFFTTQVWLQLSVATSERDELKDVFNTLEGLTLQQYDAIIAEDRGLYTNRTTEYRAIFPNNNYDPTYICDNRIRLNPPAPHR